MRIRIFLLLFFASGATAVGCGGGSRPKFFFAPVEGTVRQEGKPLAGVVVMFFSDPDAGALGPRSTSEPTDASGHYELHTDEGNDGAVLGRHRVCIFDIDKLGRRSLVFNQRRGDSVGSAQSRGEASRPTTSRVPSRYSRLNETPLRAEVQPREQVIDWDIPCDPPEGGEDSARK